MKYWITSILLVLSMTSFEVENEWTPLLDKNLTQWETYLSYSHKNNYNGEVPKDETGNQLKPIGYNKDLTHVFSVIEDKGEPVLKVSGEIYGCVFTKQEYDNYHFKLKVKWGDRKFEPRTTQLKDSGILYHSMGECGIDYWRSWMLSQEFQIMEGHMGDYWSIASSAIDIRAYLSEGKMNSVANNKQPFLTFGAGSADGYCLRNENYESPDGEWTTLELICFQDKSLHIVNGHVVMVLQHSRYVSNDKTTPLTKGKIQLQCEAAEVYYKDIQIKKITSLPKEYTALFN